MPEFLCFDRCEVFLLFVSGYGSVKYAYVWRRFAKPDVVVKNKAYGLEKIKCLKSTFSRSQLI